MFRRWRQENYFKSRPVIDLDEASKIEEAAQAELKRSVIFPTLSLKKRRPARPSSSDLLHALQLTNPRAVTEPAAHLDRDIPRRAVYAKAWEQVKAS